MRQWSLRLRFRELPGVLLVGRADLSERQSRYRMRQERLQLSGLLDRTELHRRTLQRLQSDHLWRLLPGIDVPPADARALSGGWQPLHLRARRGVLPFLRDQGHGYMQPQWNLQLWGQCTLPRGTALHRWTLLLRCGVLSDRLLRQRALHSAFHRAVRNGRRQLLRVQRRSGEQLWVRWELPLRQRTCLRQRPAALPFERLRL